jgi:hypothetical protein
VIRDDFPFACPLHQYLHKARAKITTAVQRNSGRWLRNATYSRQSFHDSEPGLREFQHHDLLIEPRPSKDPLEDHIVLPQKGVIAIERLAADVGENSIHREIPGVAHGIAPLDLRVERATLEQAFLNITERKEGAA